MKSVLSYKYAIPALIFLAFSLLFPSGTALAEEVRISAEQMEYLSESGVYIATGVVVITFEDATLHADKIIYDTNTSDATATGNVIYEDSEAIISADKIDLNFQTKKGSMYNGNIFYREHNIHLKGKELKKSAKTTFLIDEATLTTCDSSSPEWHISARDITVDKHERIKGWHGKFYLNKIPVLYTPYIWAPINRDRHTGFLFPSFGYSSKRGSYYKEGFFWAIQDNQDATLYLDYYGKLGLAEGIDYRYIVSPETNGEFWMYHVKDNVPFRDLVEIKTYHNHKFSQDLSAYIKVHSVSHYNYYETMDSTSYKRFGLSSWTDDPFGFSSEERVQKYLESNLHISKSLHGGRAYFLAQGRQSLEGSSKEVPQNIPEIAFIMNTRSRNNFSFNLSTKGNNFMRDDGQEGFRFDLYPNFFFSYGRLFNITQRVGLRETSYFLSTPSKNEARLLFDSSTVLTTKLFRKYDDFIHIIEPSIEYRHIPSVNHDDIPFFDSIDSISKTSSINYALTNRLSGFSDNNLEMRFRLSQSYSLLHVDKNFSPLLAEAIFYNGPFNISMNASYDVHDSNLSEMIASMKYQIDKYFVGTGKNFRRSTDLDQYTFEAGIKGPIKVRGKSLPVDLSGIIWYDVNGHGVQELDLRSVYNHQCWALSLNYKKTPDEYQIIFAVEFKGLGTLSLGSI